MRPPPLLLFTAVYAALLLLSRPPLAKAVTCIPTELMICTEYLVDDDPPSTECCYRLWEQEPCLCEYIGNPIVRRIFGSADGERILEYCAMDRAMSSCSLDQPATVVSP